MTIIINTHNYNYKYTFKMKIFRIFPRYTLKNLLYDISLKVWQDILSSDKKICKYVYYFQAFREYYHFHRTIFYN